MVRSTANKAFFFQKILHRSQNLSKELKVSKDGGKISIWDLVDWSSPVFIPKKSSLYNSAVAEWGLLQIQTWLVKSLL